MLCGLRSLCFQCREKHMHFPVNPKKSISNQSRWLCPSRILFISRLPEYFGCSFPARLAPEAFESAALAFAADFDWLAGALSRDRELLQSFGSLDMVLEHHSAIHRVAGLNPERIHQWLFNGPRLSLLLTMAIHGGEVDTDPDFVPFRYAGSLRPLKQRLLPVYRYHRQKRSSFPS